MKQFSSALIASNNEATDSQSLPMLREWLKNAPFVHNIKLYGTSTIFSPFGKLKMNKKTDLQNEFEFLKQRQKEIDEIEEKCVKQKENVLLYKTILEEETKKLKELTDELIKILNINR